MLDLIPKELQKDLESLPQSYKEKIVVVLLKYPDLVPDIVYIWTEKKLAFENKDMDRYKDLIEKEKELLESLMGKE